MDVRRPIWPLICLLATLAWVPTQMQAQVAITATVTGYVSDPSGAFVPGAAVTIVNMETAFTRTTATSAEGAYTFPGLPIGTYDLTVNKAGFQSYKQSGITLQVNQTARIDLTLQLGGVAQAIEVVGQAAMLDTETSSQGQVVEQRSLADLPLDGRNPIALVSLVAGATQVNAPAILEGYRGGSWASVNGSRINQNNFLFDANNYSSVYANTGLNYPNPDALQEFKLLTHNYSAEFGRNAGSVFNAVTKSGTNEFHGSVWEFLRNDALNARNFFSSEVPLLRQNQFGVTAGGPIKKNKVFIFGSYQGFRIKQESLLANAPVSTALERAGNFSESGVTIIDPQTGEPFPDNIIPEERLSSISTNWYNQYVPLPNNPDGRTITYLEGAPKRVDQLLFKVDWQISAKQTLSGRWFRDKSSVVYPFNFSIPKYSTFDLIVPEQDGSLTHTYAISPTLLNQAHFGVNHGFFDNGFTKDSLALKVTNSSMGINMPDLRPYSPSLSIGGDVGGWANAEVESGLSHQYGDTLTWVRGKHTFKFGMEVLVDDYHNRSFAYTNGSFDFDGSFTGNGMADFLLGLTSYVQHNAGYFVDSQSKKYYSFVQDDWKVSPRLTLNLGFRYELNGPVVDNTATSPFPNQQATYKSGMQSTLFPTAPRGLVFPGDPGIPAGLYPTPKWNLEPRLGFAWSPGGTGQWAVRGAIGMFADIPFMDVIGQTHANQPYLLITRVYSPAGGFADPYRDFPGGDPWPFTFNPENVNFVLPATIQGTNLDYVDPRITQWNLSVERAFGANWLFNLSYVGSVGRHLLQVYQANPARYIPGTDAQGNPLSTPDNVESRRIDSPGTLSTVMLGASVARSSFNSLQFTVQKRMSQGLSFLSSYTYSHSIDNSSTTTYGGGIPNANPFNYGSGERGNSEFDRRHVYSLSFIYDLPESPTGNWAMRNIVGGWGLAGIFSASTGGWGNIWTNQDRNLDGDWTDRPNQVGDPLAVDRSSRAKMIEHWFNTAAFVANPIGQPGSLGRDVIAQPNSWTLNFSLLRDFPISEKYGRFQFRSEFFNIFNNVNLGCPVNDLQSGEFGRLTCAGSPRLIQFGLKYLW
ncbi:MAG: TonB-dependent receptor [Acidobacteriia bacterium]|nr:TonB-dependent receptor [Terriglobia bacterium]